MSKFLLIHSPLLGPSVWEPCAEILRTSGHDTAVPDLRSAVTQAEGWFDRYAALCHPYLGDDTVVVGHSGSGVVLPLVVTESTARAVVFVDAVLPARSGPTTPSARSREFVSRLLAGDLLPVWSNWWPEQMSALVPDPHMRAVLIAEQVAVPRAFYDVAVPPAAGWDLGRAISYLHLSPAYDDPAADAEARGWTVKSIPGGHLDMVNCPHEIAAALVELS